MDGSFHVSHKNVQNLPRNLPECIGDDAQSLLSDELDWSDVRRFMVSQRAAFGAGVGSFLSRACAGAARSSPRRGHERRGLGLLLLDRAAEHRQHLALAPREERLLDHALVRHLRDKRTLSARCKRSRNDASVRRHAGVPVPITRRIGCARSGPPAAAIGTGEG
eukprot:5959736-Pleurochrysis_carterae.AAC.3